MYQHEPQRIWYTDCLLLLVDLEHILTHWSRVTHIWVGKLTSIGSDSGLSPGRREAIIWTNAGMLLIGHLETNLNEMLLEIRTSSLKKMRLKKVVREMLSISSRP